MRARRKGYLVLLILIVGCLLLGCNNKIKEINKKDTIYENEKVLIYKSNMVDTYLIASALYYDFNNNNFMSSQDDIATETKEYFSKYKEHSFIKNYGKYLDVDAKDISFNVLVPLTSYVSWDSKEDIPEEMLKSNLFSSRQEFEQFYHDLEEFYYDTKAEQFFANEEHWYKELGTEIKELFRTTDMNKYTTALEAYAGNKEMYYKNQNIEYTILTSLFKPSGAAFFKFQSNDETKFVCFTSSYSYNGNGKLFDSKQLLENAIHEYCHMYINSAVEKNMELIQKLTADKEKRDYVCEIYQNMEWNRIVDENIVRAVETRVYANVLENEEDAFNQILQKEITLGGFQHVEPVYEKLKDYEEKRNQYLSIDDFMEELIYTLFQ